MAEITEQGINIRTLLEIKDDLTQGYRDIDTGWDLRPESPDGQKLALDSEAFANMEEALAAIFNAVDPRSASGQQLDNIADIIDLERRDATPSTATVLLTGTSGTVVPAGTEIRNTKTETTWAMDNEVTLDGGGEAIVNVTCDVTGPEPAGVGDLSIIADSVTGLQSVTNPEGAALGDEEESDSDFRIRRLDSVARLGENQVDSLRSAIADVEGVSRVRIYENDEDTVDDNDLRPHSLMIIVQGGENDNLIELIANGKNPGTGLNATNVALTDNRVVEETETRGGHPVRVAFFRPVLTTVSVEVEIAGAFDEGKVKQAIIDYAAGRLLTDGAGFRRIGFGIGQDVILSRLYTPVNKVIPDDSDVISLRIGTNGLSTNNVDIDFNGLAVFDAANITVISV